MSDKIKTDNDWIKCKSKKHPDRNYYFNKVTGESSWSDPKLKNSSDSKTPANSELSVLKLQNPKKNIAADRLKRLQTSLKNNQLKSESKQSVNKSHPCHKNSAVKLCNVIPPTSLQVISSQTAQKRKSNEALSPSKKIKTTLRKTATFTPSQTSSPLPSAKKAEQKSPLPSAKKLELPSPKLSPIPNKGAANARLKELQISLEKQQSLIPSDDILLEPSASNTSANQFSEEMDWEPSDLSETTDNNNDRVTMSEYYDNIGENSFKNSSSNNSFKKSYSKTDFYFVVDTNVLLDNLTFVKDLSGTIFGVSIKTVIMIPYKVLQELDGLKSRETTATLAIRAIKLLNEKLASKDTHFQGQNAKHSKEELIPIDNSDDEILNCCLQIQETCKNVVLLSNDVNLKNKAIINDIKILNSLKSEILDTKNNNTILNLMNGSKQM